MKTLYVILFIFSANTITTQLTHPIDSTTFPIAQLPKDTTAMDIINFTKKVQLALTQKGFYNDEISGKFNIATKGALIKWCKAMGIQLQFLSKEIIILC